MTNRKNRRAWTDPHDNLCPIPHLGSLVQSADAATVRRLRVKEKTQRRKNRYGFCVVLKAEKMLRPSCIPWELHEPVMNREGKAVMHSFL